MIKKVAPKRAAQIADKYRLKIYHEWSSPLDGITSFQFGLDEKAIKEKLSELILAPVLYFAVQESKSHYYINYLVYHPFDWADYKVPLIKNWLNKIDSHRHDTESVCLRVDKAIGTLDIVTVSHYTHLFEFDTELEIIIEDHSHAIKPIDHLRDDKFYVVYNPKSYKLDNIFEWSEYKTKMIKNYLKQSKVSWLDEQFDGNLKLRTATGMYRSKGLQHLPGDIINDPEKLFRIGERFGR